MVSWGALGRESRKKLIAKMAIEVFERYKVNNMQEVQEIVFKKLQSDGWLKGTKKNIQNCKGFYNANTQKWIIPFLDDIYVKFKERQSIKDGNKINLKELEAFKYAKIETENENENEVQDINIDEYKDKDKDKKNNILRLFLIGIAILTILLILKKKQ